MKKPQLWRLYLEACDLAHNPRLSAQDRALAARLRDEYALRYAKLGRRG